MDLDLLIVITRIYAELTGLFSRSRLLKSLTEVIGDDWDSMLKRMKNSQKLRFSVHKEQKHRGPSESDSQIQDYSKAVLTCRVCSEIVAKFSGKHDFSEIESTIHRATSHGKGCGSTEFSQHHPLQVIN